MIRGDGNVGIGTVSPEGKLDTYGAGYFGFQDYRTQAVQKVLVLRAEPISGAYSQSRFNFYTTPGTTVNGVSKLTIKSQYAADAESSELFTLAGNGNVGIGTASPSQKLSIGEYSTNNNIWISRAVDMTDPIGTIRSYIAIGINDTTEATVGTGDSHRWKIGSMVSSWVNPTYGYNTHYNDDLSFSYKQRGYAEVTAMIIQ